MKIRLDFVSNSSSSSYVIELSKPIDQYSLEEFKSLFNSDKVLTKLYARLKTMEGEPIEGRRYKVHIDDWTDEFPENAQRILNEDYSDSEPDPIKEVFSYQ